MKNAYQKKLEELKDTEVTIHRSSAPEIKGKVQEVDEDGCYIVNKEGVAADAVLKIFIAFESIQGIATTEWDFDLIS